MEKIKVSTFEGVDVTQGLIFIDEDTYDIRNIITVDHVIIEPRRSIYRVCIFGGLGLMFLKGVLAELGLSLLLSGLALWGFARPKHGVLVKTLSNSERLFISQNFEELEKIGRAVRNARYWQKSFSKQISD